MPKLLEDGDELALPWDDLADGRAWQLVRGRDFFVNPREVDEAARNAGVRLGKVPRTLRTLKASVSSVWVQFADYQVEPGMPCPSCGSDDLRRINDEWAICANCESTLLVDTRPKPAGGGGLVVAAAEGRADEDGEDGSRLRIFVPEGGAIRDERKRLAALRDAGDGDGDEPKSKLKPAGERKEEKKAQIRESRDNTRRERQEARNRMREQQRQRREAERETPAEGPKLRTRGRKAEAGPEQESAKPAQQETRETLDRFTNVRLWAVEGRKAGRYWGYGYDRKGHFMLLEVTLDVTAEGVPVEDPGHPGHALHSVHAVLSAPFSGAVDADALLARTDGMPPEDVLRLASR